MKPPSRPVKTAVLCSYVIGAILVLLPFHAFFTTWLGSNVGHLDLIRIWKEIIIALLGLPGLWLFWQSAHLRTWARRAFLLQMIALYAAIHLALGIWGLKHSQLNSTAFIYALIINLRFVGFFLLCVVFASYSDWLYRNWRRLLLAPAAIVIAFGLLQRFVLPYDFLRHFGYSTKTIPAYQTVDSDISFRRLQSTLRGANPLGAYFVLVLPAFLFVRRRIWRWLALAGGLVVLYFTYSRSAWIGLAMAAGILALWHYGASKKTKEIVLVVTAVILLAVLGVYALRGNHDAQDALFHTSSGSANISSNAERATAIRNAFSDVVHNPLGRGPGTAGPASFRNSGHPARIAEDYYLQIAQETGIIGLVIFLIINALVVREFWRVRYDTLSQVLLASFVGISFVNLVSHAWTDDTLSLLWWGLAGIAFGHHRFFRADKSSKRSLS